MVKAVRAEEPIMKVGVLEWVPNGLSVIVR